MTRCRSATEPRATFDELDDDWGRSAVRLHLGHGLRLAGRTDAAEQVLALAVELSRATGLPNNLARSYVELGEAALYRGSADEADAVFGAGRPDCRRRWQRDAAALALLGRGAVARWRADPAAARGHYREALAVCLAADIPRGEARARAGIASTELDEGAVDVAAAELHRALEIARQIGDASLIAVVREQSARAAAAIGDEAERAGCSRRPTRSARSKVDPAARSSSEMYRRLSARSRRLPIRRRRSRRRARRCPSSP